MQAAKETSVGMVGFIEVAVLVVRSGYQEAQTSLKWSFYSGDTLRTLLSDKYVTHKISEIGWLIATTATLDILQQMWTEIDDQFECQMVNTKT